VPDASPSPPTSFGIYWIQSSHLRLYLPRGLFAPVCTSLHAARPTHRCDQHKSRSPSLYNCRYSRLLASSLFDPNVFRRMLLAHISSLRCSVVTDQVTHPHNNKHDHTAAYFNVHVLSTNPCVNSKWQTVLYLNKCIRRRPLTTIISLTDILTLCPMFLVLACTVSSPMSAYAGQLRAAQYSPRTLLTATDKTCTNIGIRFQCDRPTHLFTGRTILVIGSPTPRD